MDGQEYIFGNKKKNPIDVDEQGTKRGGKKNNKNLNKTLAAEKLMQELQSKKKGSGSQKKAENGPESDLDAKQKRKIDDIKSVLQNHKRSTIRRILEKHNYDKQLAIQQLFTIPQDEQQSISNPKTEEKEISSKQQKQKKKKQTKEEIGSQILNQLYQNNQQIDPSQFEQLFAEITDIIQQEEKSIGMDLFQINEFIDECYLVKNFILEGQHEIYIDENDQLYRQTEMFMEELIKNRVARENKRRQDFPSLGDINKSQPHQKNYIQKIQEQYNNQKRKQEYFQPSRVPQVYRAENNNNHLSVFSLKNNPRSYSDILQLSKQYNDMGVDNLKFIYSRFQDINLCKQFIDRFYPNKKREIKLEKVEKNLKKTVAYNKPVAYKRVQDQNFKNFSLREVREELDHLFKLRSMFRMTKGKTTNIAYRKQLERLACRDDSRIRKLSEIARFKVIREMSDQHPQYIDLHGYREEEIDQLFDDISDMIKHEFKRGNSKLETVRLGSNVYCIVKAMTGKGLHSKYNKSVLKPALLDWCSSNNVKTTENEDSINVYIEVK